MRILLVSTYELGHQPLHLASPASRLRHEGHDVRVLDLAVEESTVDTDWAEAIAYSVPMHTALRLAIESASIVRVVRPELPIAFYGLYAGMGGHDLGVTHLVGEYEPLLVEWTLDSAPRTLTAIAPQKFGVPHRRELPSLARYARLIDDRGERQVGYVEASHGCRHRCRHCPIPAVYDGRFRSVGLDIVLADVDQLVAAGAEHITFGDPDFLNAPRYSLEVLRAANRAHPGLTSDLTVKVSPILDHRHLWPEIASLGVVMVVSAFETTNNRALEILDKGHTSADMAAAVAIVTEAGIELRPSWLPFTPWTEPNDLADILEFLAEHDMLASVDPVQLSIRLLVPQGSLLADRSEMGEYDTSKLSLEWTSPFPEVDALQKRVALLAEEGVGAPPLVTMARIWDLVIGRPFPPVSARPRPRLSEPWFCCSEPTSQQLLSVL
ncbi:CUAEP/CCAEP-tail radical SAM protein [soil metagenome]